MFYFINKNNQCNVCKYKYYLTTHTHMSEVEVYSVNKLTFWAMDKNVVGKKIRTPDGRRPMLYIAPGTLEGPLRGPQDSRAAPLTTARRPSFFSHENWLEKSCGTRPATGRSPHGTPRDASRAFYGLTVRWKRRENREQPAQHRGAPRRPYGWWKMSRCPWEPWGSRPGTVRNWPKFLFLLAVRVHSLLCHPLVPVRSLDTPHFAYMYTAYTCRSVGTYTHNNELVSSPTMPSSTRFAILIPQSHLLDGGRTVVVELQNRVIPAVAVEILR